MSDLMGDCSKYFSVRQTDSSTFFFRNVDITVDSCHNIAIGVFTVGKRMNADVDISFRKKTVDRILKQIYEVVYYGNVVAIIKSYHVKVTFGSYFVVKIYCYFKLF